MLCPAYYTLAVQFRKTIYKVVGTVFYAVVGREVDYTQILRDFVALHKLTCVAVGCTAKQQVDFIKRCFACESQVGLADKSLVDIGNGVACVACRVDPLDFHVGMVDEQSQKFARCVSGSAYYTSLYHASGDLSLRSCTE